MHIKPILYIYLAGRIDGLSQKEATDWRNDAIKILSENGLVGVCPILHGGDFANNPENGVINYARQAKIFEVDCDLIYRCDAIIANMGELSFGTSQEIFYGSQCLNIPVFAYNNKSTTSAFYYNTISLEKETLEEIIEIIKAYNLKPTKGWAGSPKKLIRNLSTNWSQYFLPSDRLTKPNV